MWTTTAKGFIIVDLFTDDWLSGVVGVFVVYKSFSFYRCIFDLFFSISAPKLENERIMVKKVLKQ